MTRLLEEVVAEVSALPEEAQDRAARALIIFVQELQDDRACDV
jgi:hypothetical protein